MKIFYWAQLFWPDVGGIPMIAKKLVTGLHARGHEMIVVAAHGPITQPDVTDFEGIPVYRFPIRTTLVQGDLSGMLKIRQTIGKLKQAFQPDILHFDFFGEGAYFQVATANVQPTPTVVSLHTDLSALDAGPNTVLGQLLRQADWITTDSADTLALASQAVPEIETHASVIYTGMENPPISPDPLPLEQPRLLCLGRLVHEKGFALVIEAMTTLKQRYPDLRLTIAGDGAERGELERQVATQGLGDVVEFIGNVDNRDVFNLLNRVTIVVIPSRYRESFPLVALEASQMARPIVATNVGGLPECIVDGETGLIIEPENSQAIVEAVSHLLDDPDLATRLGQAGRERAQRLFSVSGFVSHYEALYQSLQRAKQ